MRHRNRNDYLAKVTNFVFVFVIDNIIEDFFRFFLLFPFGWTIQSISFIHTNFIQICTVLIVSELKQKWFSKPIDKKNVLVKIKTAIGKSDSHVYTNSEFVIDIIILLFITIYVVQTD